MSEPVFESALPPTDTLSAAMRSICVYCGSSPGFDPVYVDTARTLGAMLAASGIRLVYGGATVGLMGEVANAVLAGGGQVTGVIPTALFGREVGHKGLTELIEVDSMHERKLAMFDASDAFVAMPGGLGTLEEVAEVATWAQLGVHRKPIVLLDVRGYFSQLLAFLDGGVAAGFIKEQQRSLIGWTDSVHDVLNVIYAYRVEPVDKWLDADET